MRNRFRAQEVWERMGYDVAECLEFTDHSPIQQAFRTLLFSRIVPCVKDIGLWGPKVRHAYADLGVLDAASTDLDALMRDDEEIAERVDAEKAKYEAEMAARRAEVHTAIARRGGVAARGGGAGHPACRARAPHPAPHRPPGTTADRKAPLWSRGGGIQGRRGRWACTRPWLHVSGVRGCPAGYCPAGYSPHSARGLARGAWQAGQSPQKVTSASPISKPAAAAGSTEVVLAGGAAHIRHRPAVPAHEVMVVAARVRSAARSPPASVMPPTLRRKR